MINLTKKDILRTGQDPTISNMKKAYKLIFMSLTILTVKMEYKKITI